MPEIDLYTKQQTDTKLADKADVSTTYTKTEVDTKLTDKQDKLVSETNIKTVNSASILGAGDLGVAGTWEKLDLSSLPTNFADGDMILMNFAITRRVTSGPSSWTGNINSQSVVVDYGGSIIPAIYKLNTQERYPVFPLFHTAGAYISIITMSHLAQVADWNNSDTSTRLFSISASIYNATGCVSGTPVDVSRSNISTYVTEIYRLRK